MKVWVRCALFEPESLIEIAQAAERSGFDGVGLSDHILYPRDLGTRYPYAEEGYSAVAPDVAVRYIEEYGVNVLPALEHA